MDFDYILNGGKHKKPVKANDIISSIFHGTNRSMRVNRMRNVPQRAYLQKTNRMTTSRFFDSDRDGVANGLDCFPYDQNRHGFLTKAANFVQGKGFRESEPVVEIKEPRSRTPQLLNQNQKELIKDLKSPEEVHGALCNKVGWGPCSQIASEMYKRNSSGNVVQFRARWREYPGNHVVYISRDGVVLDPINKFQGNVDEYKKNFNITSQEDITSHATPSINEVRNTISDNDDDQALNEVNRENQ